MIAATIARVESGLSLARKVIDPPSPFTFHPAP